MVKSGFGIFIAFLVLLFTGILTAQDTNDSQNKNRDLNKDPFLQDENATSQVWVDDLKNKLSLSDDQATQLSDILFRYNRESSILQDTPETIGNTRSELQKRYSTEIEGILDENQKTQWQSYKDSWWNSVNSGAKHEGTEINRDYHNKMDKDSDKDNPPDENETDPDIK